MKRAATILAAAVAVALSTMPAAGTASAKPPSDPGPGPVESDREWQRYRDYPNHFLCESHGAFGVVIGRWQDWRCDDDGVLWVKD
ncbi:hypothetical protein SAMN05216188_12112 [Lentzea xinjiangensis]|uniref:Secreted protein n=1 Tax=Lentzea xinjiangensis TaxID=402600 RepID=A0A1H9UC12_9PSEU|nr:hypothetical protein [Lentzea xinjiangensis]SES06872.1 hypothetical protein SAMN05216188_12112 [Lentzea xinjiangensis]